MSEKTDFQLAIQFLQMLKDQGKAKVPFSDLPNSLKKIAKDLGYGENDIVPVPKIEEYLTKSWGHISPNPQVPKSPQEVWGQINPKSPSPQDISTNDEDIGDNEKAIIAEIRPYLTAIGKVVLDADRTEKRLAVYLLLKNREMYDPDLRKELAPLGQFFSRNKEPYKIKTIKNVITFVRNSPHIWSSKDPTTGMFIYRLKDDTVKRILGTLQIILAEQEILSKQEELKQAEREKIVEAFAKFIREYVDNDGRSIYLEKLKDLLTLKPSHSLVVDWKHLASFNSVLADQVITNPDDVLPALEDAVQIVLKEELFQEGFKVRVRFINLPRTLKVKDVGSEHINQLIQVEGVISRQVEHRPFVYEAVFVCKKCGAEISLLQKPYEPIVKPSRCDACGSKELDLSVEKSRFIDAQWFRVQDLPEGSEGMVSRFIKAIALGELVDTFLPGDKVRVVGILRVRMTKKNGLPILEKILEVNNIEVLTKRIQDVELDEARIQQIKEVAKRKNIVELITNSIAPSILGYEDVKKGIALALFSGGDVMAPDGTVTRGASHVLLVGDPGTAKSTISRFLKQVIPRGIWTTAKTSSAAGLTATAVQDKETGTWTLEAGALVLANGGICVIDEFDKMNDKDRAAIHEALEQGTISLSKAGINVVLPAKTTVIAIGNPKYGRFDPHRDKDKPLVSQIDLPPTLLSRFDLIFPIRDIPEEKKDKDIADHILRFKVGVLEAEKPSVEHLPVDLLRDYIAYARNYVDPVLTKEAYQFLVEYYAKTRSLAVNDDGTIKTIPITARQLEGLWRLARARARMRLSERIELEDVKDVVELFERNMRRLITDEEGNLDVTILEVGKSTREIDREATAVSIIERLEAQNEEGAPYEDVIELLAQKLNTPKNEAKKVIEHLMEDGRVYQPRIGFLRISPDE